MRGIRGIIKELQTILSGGSGEKSAKKEAPAKEAASESAGEESGDAS